MTELLYDGDITLHAGDCVQVLRDLPDASIDAVVTDPPYGLEFMGQDWDSFRGDAWRTAAGITATGYTDGGNRVARPSFGGGDSANPTCATCGGRKRGARKCECAEPDWRVKGKPLEQRDNNAAQMRAFQAWCELWATECLRVLRPGGHMLAFGGTRTYHRLTCAVEDAGFEVRDSITWLYGSGFPKSLDVSKAIDKQLGATREVVGQRTDGRYAYGFSDVARRPIGGRPDTEDAERIGGFVSDPAQITRPATDDARRWQGWGTALKPASEPILVARKPLTGTVAGNVLTHGVGALNIDGCRTEFTSTADERESKDKNRHGDFGTLHGGNEVYGDYTTLGERDNYDAQGRWPANVLLTHAAGCMQVGERTVSSDSHHPAARPAGGIGNDGHAGQGGLVERSARAERVADWRCEDGCPVAELDAQSGVTRDGVAGSRSRGWPLDGYVGGTSSARVHDTEPQGYGGVGGASRFFPTFRYEPKAGSSERPRVAVDDSDLAHPTVKPLELMRWLVRLVAPRGALVLDPFAGSGTTGEACLREGMRCVLIERDERYLPLIRARLTKPQQETLL